jgi:predicted DNA-binding transcriptional regulator AlpA
MSGNANRDEGGQFESKVDDEEILRYFREGRPFHTAQEVAERFGVDRSTAYRRLSRMEDSAGLEKVSLGSRTVVWWLTDEDHPSDNNGVPDDDPFFAAEAGEGGPDDVSERTDEYLAELDGEA